MNEYVKLPILSALTPSQICSAFANAGYLEMLPASASFEGQNSRGQFVYTCAWNDKDEDGETLEPCNVYVSVNAHGMISTHV